MTAAHVVTAALEQGEPALAGSVGNRRTMGGRKVDQWEVFPDRDVALLFCEIADATVLDTWLVNRVQVLTDLSSFGYPHAVTRSNETSTSKLYFAHTRDT
jgi:hypothetical protein